MPGSLHLARQSGQHLLNTVHDIGDHGWIIAGDILGLLRIRVDIVEFGIDQPKISALKQGRLSGFSIERLMRLLLALGRDIEITVKVKPRSRSAARLRVA